MSPSRPWLFLAFLLPGLRLDTPSILASSPWCFLPAPKFHKIHLLWQSFPWGWGTSLWFNLLRSKKQGFVFAFFFFFQGFLHARIFSFLAFCLLWNICVFLCICVSVHVQGQAYLAAVGSTRAPCRLHGSNCIHQPGGCPCTISIALIKTITKKALGDGIYIILQLLGHSIP